MANKYRALNGLNYVVNGEEVRREIGDILEDLTPEIVAAYRIGVDIELIGESQAIEVVEPVLVVEDEPVADVEIVHAVDDEEGGDE